VISAERDEEAVDGGGEMVSDMLGGPSAGAVASSRYTQTATPRRGAIALTCDEDSSSSLLAEYRSVPGWSTNRLMTVGLYTPVLPSSRWNMAATRSLAWMGHGIGGAIAAAILWLVVNYCWTVNGAGLLQRQGWPYSRIYLFAAAGAVLGSAGGLLSQRRQRRYARELAAISASMHFTLRPDVSREDMKDYEDLHLIQKWSSARNRMIGRVGGLDVEMLDYTCAEKGGDSDSYHSQTLLLLPAPEGEFPAFELRPRDMTVKLLSSMFGVEGITFRPAGAPPGDAAAIEQFSRLYHLSKGLEAEIQELQSQIPGHHPWDGKGHHAIRKVFTIKVLRFLAEHPGWYVQSDGKYLALWRDTTIVRPADRPGFLSDGIHIRAALTQPGAFASDLPPLASKPPRDLMTIRARILGTIAGTVIGFFVGSISSMGHFVMNEPIQPPHFLLGGLSFFGLCLLGIAVGACVGNRLLYYPVLLFLRRQDRTLKRTPERPHQQPGTSTARVESHGKDLTITCPPAGIWRGNGKFLLFWCVVWNSFVIPFTVLFLPAAFRGEVRHEDTNEPASPLFALVLLTPFWLIGIGSVLALLHNGRRWARLSVRDGQFAVEVHGLFSTNRHHWSRTEVKEVRAGLGPAANEESGSEDLTIVPRSGPPVRLLGYRGKAEIAWMAQLVRQALGLSDAAEQTDQD
jgi:hypothetical protein